MCREREGKFNVWIASSNEQDPMTQLRRAEVGRTYRSKGCSVPNFFKRGFDLPSERSFGVGQHSFHIFHEEHARPYLIYQPYKVFEEKIPWIILHALAMRAETLAAWSPGNQIDVVLSRKLSQLGAGHVSDIAQYRLCFGMIQLERGDSVTIEIHADTAFEPRLL